MANAIWAPESPWARFSGKAVSGKNSYTDSPTGNYGNNLNKSLYFDSLITISNANAAFIEFNSRWDIEPSWDFGQFQITTNGIKWNNLAGKQPDGQPGYDGTQEKWVHEHVDISDFIGSSFQLRFNLLSDEYVTGDGWYIDDFKILVYRDSVLTGLKNKDKFVQSFKLLQNYPNPFNPETQIRFEMAKTANVSVKIYDALGREIRTLYNGVKQVGQHQLTWDGKNDKGLQVASGIYFYRMKSENYRAMRKLVLVR
jgi:hypothetical protein